MFTFAITLTLMTGGQSLAQKAPEGKIDIDPKLPWSERMALSEIYRQQQGTSSTYGKNRKHWGYVTGLVLSSIQEVWKHSGKNIYFDFAKSYGDLNENLLCLACRQVK